MSEDSMKLGRYGKNGSVDVSKLQKGINAKAFEDNQKAKLIFDHLNSLKIKDDKSQRNAATLDQMELAYLQTELKKAAGNGTLSEREVDKWLKQQGLNNVSAKDMFEFLDIAAQQSEMIEYSDYKDDGTVSVTRRDRQKNQTITTNYDVDGNIVSTTTKFANNSTVTQEGENGRVLGQTFKERNNDITYVYVYEGDDGAPKTIKIDNEEFTCNDEGQYVGSDDSCYSLGDNGLLKFEKNLSPEGEEESKDEPFKDNRNDAGQLVSYAKNGEGFDATARRLGFEKGTDEYNEFVKANEKAAKAKSFQVGGEVIIPTELENKVNKNGLDVNAKEESKKYNKSVLENTDISQYESEDQKQDYTVAKDDNFWKIAKANLEASGVISPTKQQIAERMNVIMKLNSDIQNPDALQVGATIKVPKKPQAEGAENSEGAGEASGGGQSVTPPVAPTPNPADTTGKSPEPSRGGGLEAMYQSTRALKVSRHDTGETAESSDRKDKNRKMYIHNQSTANRMYNLAQIHKQNKS